MYYKLCPTDCQNIIRLFEECEPLEASEQRTLELVRKIKELQEIRHADNLHRSEIQKRLKEVRSHE
jgi:hypothetical protein